MRLSPPYEVVHTTDKTVLAYLYGHVESEITCQFLQRKSQIKIQGVISDTT